MQTANLSRCCSLPWVSLKTGSHRMRSGYSSRCLEVPCRTLEVPFGTDGTASHVSSKYWFLRTTAFKHVAVTVHVRSSHKVLKERCLQRFFVSTSLCGPKLDRTQNGPVLEVTPPELRNRAAPASAADAKVDFSQNFIADENPILYGYYLLLN